MINRISSNMIEPTPATPNSSDSDELMQNIITQVLPEESKKLSNVSTGVTQGDSFS